MSPSGELLVLDSVNSNIHRISTPLSRNSRLKLIAGSPEGHSGHVDGRPREARLNHPKAITVDDAGNVYVADTTNMAIRRIGDEGVTTIAGGKLGRGGGHVDGAGETAKFSSDFDVTFVRSSCSLLVVDRGNSAIREIQLHSDDCTASQNQNMDNDDFYLGKRKDSIAVIIASAFFGYMLALLQYRVRAMFSRQDESAHVPKKRTASLPQAYQRTPPYRSVRPPLIPPEYEPERTEDSIFTSVGKAILNIFAGSKMSRPMTEDLQQQYLYEPSQHLDTWHIQDTYDIPVEDEPPPSEHSRIPTQKKSYPLMARDLEKTQLLRKIQALENTSYDDHRQQQHYLQDIQRAEKKYQHHQRNQVGPHAYCEQGFDSETNEVMIRAVQEQNGRREAVVINAVNYADQPAYRRHNNSRSRLNYPSCLEGY